jgi:hypothetical protein
MKFDLKPMSFGEILDGSFKILRLNPGVFIGIQLLYLVPSVALSPWLTQAQTHVFRGRHPAGVLAAVLLDFTLMSALILVMWGATSAAAVQVIMGQPTSIGKATARYLRGFWPTLGAALLAGIVGGVYSLCLIFPGVIYYLRRCLSWPVLLVEGGSWRGAVGRSKVLVMGKSKGAGRLDRVFGATLVLNVLEYACMFGFGWLIPAGLKDTMVGALLKAIPAVVFGALLPIALVLIYFDARIRDEGYDLELRAKAAGAVDATFPNAAGSVTSA